MSYAEFETDKIIYDTYFQDKVGLSVEVGCADPYLYSMSMLFREKGWRCIGVEPNPKFIQKHRELGHEIYPYAATESHVGLSDFDLVDTPMGSFTYESFSSLRVKPEYNQKYGVVCIEDVIQVQCKPLDLILQEAGVDSIDLLSIDTEGWELEVMRGFSVDKYKPKVVLLENYFHDPDYTAHMKGIGYILDKVVEYNYIYVRDIFAV
jgi:FkbM family methyltransferase